MSRTKVRKIMYKVAFSGCILAVSVAVFLFIMIPWMHAFLSKSKPVPAENMVVSGWLWTFTEIMDQAAVEFISNDYQRIIVTGDSANITHAKESFIQRGIAGEQIEIAPRIHHRGWQNTFQEAEGLKWYLEKKVPDVHAVNVVAGSMHGKKTFVIFKRVLGKSCNVGIITFKTGYYNEKRLWAEPAAIKWTMEYFIGYLYALVWNFPVKQ